jgi:hypothetical protein
MRVQVWLRGALVLTGVVLAIGSVITRPRLLPENALLYLDDASETYYAPTCDIALHAKLRRTTFGEAQRLAYRADPECRQSGGFRSEERSLTGLLLVRLGILDPFPSRWNGDGSWRW